MENARTSDNIVTGEPLFNSQTEYDEFIDRHKQCDLGYADIRTYEGDAYLGIDAGSTTTKLVLITGHRRENFGDGFISMVTAMKDLSEKYPDVDFVYPMHLNPNVRKPIHEVFGEDLTKYKNFFFIEPLQYLEFVYLMEKSYIVLTDSGGIQEEAPGLGKNLCS